jgi:hypothetical protein
MPNRKVEKDRYDDAQGPLNPPAYDSSRVPRFGQVRDFTLKGL